MELIERQQFTCALSGLPLTPEDAALDHIVPISLGGDHSIANAQWLHRDINKMKNNLAPERFIQLCKLVAGAK